MNSIIRRDILRILTKAINAIRKKHMNELSLLSNRINHNSSIFQDEDSITLAVVVYSVSKLIERNDGKLDSSFTTYFKKAKTHLENNDFEGYRQYIRKIIDKVSDVDNRLGKYILHVYNQAEIKKGSKLFYNGLSMSRVSELLGITQWELMSYIGKTNINESFAPDKRIKKRLAHARRIFGL